MSDIVILLVLLLSIVSIYLFIRLKNNGGLNYFKTDDGKGILKGILLAISAFFVIGVFILMFSRESEASESFRGTWFNDARVFIGLDFTDELSPQCKPNSVDEKGTSNVGFNVNMWQSHSRNVRVNSQYTHHSCALGPDRNTYDAIGIQLEWIPWQRTK